MTSNPAQLTERGARQAKANAPAGASRQIVRICVLSLMCAALGWVAWIIVVFAVSDAFDHDDPSVALRWRSDSSAALVALAARRLSSTASPDEIQAARSELNRALAADPLQWGVLTLLADVAGRQGRAARSETLWRLAAARSQRDAAAQAQVINLDGRDGEYAKAIGRADVLFRVRSELAPQLVTFLASLAEVPRATGALTDWLGGNPPARGQFFEAVAKRPDGPAASFRLLTVLATKGDAIGGADLSPLLTLLIHAGQLEDAYKMWSGLLPADKQAVAGPIFDGSFLFPPSGLPFEWTIKPPAGASVELVQTLESGAGHTLRMEFVGAREPDLNVSQVLHLTPGKYRFRYQAQAEELRVARGIVWRVSCWSPPWTVLAESNPLRGNQAWSEIDLDVAVPASGCGFQLVQPAVKALSESDQAISGAAQFTNFRLISVAGR